MDIAALPSDGVGKHTRWVWSKTLIRDPLCSALKDNSYISYAICNTRLSIENNSILLESQYDRVALTIGRLPVSV